MAGHSHKAIREAIEYAEERGWRFEKGGLRSHAYGKLLCPAAGGCMFFVRSTPRSPDLHARRIIRAVDNCPHQ